MYALSETCFPPDVSHTSQRYQQLVNGAILLESDRCGCLVETACGKQYSLSPEHIYYLGGVGRVVRMHDIFIEMTTICHIDGSSNTDLFAVLGSGVVNLQQYYTFDDQATLDLLAHDIKKCENYGVDCVVTLLNYLKGFHLWVTEYLEDKQVAQWLLPLLAHIGDGLSHAVAEPETDDTGYCGDESPRECLRIMRERAAHVHQSTILTLANILQRDTLTDVLNCV
jgi:hypothetical protein